MELYIIRHAQSTNNALADQRQRVCDPALTEAGERQAELLAQHLATGCQPISGVAPEDVPANGPQRGYGLTHLYCSPMLRSLQTAQPVAQALDLRAEVWIGIHEHGGMYLDEPDGTTSGRPGLTRREILDLFPGYILPPGITDQGWWSQGFEEWAGCHARAAEVAKALVERATARPYDRLALITHGAFSDALLKALVHGGGPPASNGAGTPFWYNHENTGIDRLNLYPDGHISIKYLNRLMHLPADIVT